MPKKKPDSKKLVDSIKHKDKRVNIPTEELRDFVVEDEQKPKTMLYPRDPSLDPQLVWKGKDEQDQQDLAVPVVPIYIQEKILPQAIIEDLRRRSLVDHPDEQTSFFADFNNIKFEDMVDFYKHEQNWSNRMILGDSLLVMTSLAEKEGLKGKVQMIYLDPPFNSQRAYNVIFPDKSGKLSRAQIQAFEDTWFWSEESQQAFDDIMRGSYSLELKDMMKAFKEFMGPSNLMAYLTMMAVRLVEMHRVLKMTGSLYLHCDPTARFNGFRLRSRWQDPKSAGKPLINGRRVYTSRSTHARASLGFPKTTSICWRKSGWPSRNRSDPSRN